MKVTNIDWDIDMDEVYELMENISDEDMSKVLDMSAKAYSKLSKEERNERAYDVFRHCPGKLYDFLLLPEEVSLDGIEEEDVADYLSDTYGYCINSLNISKEDAS